MPFGVSALHWRRHLLLRNGKDNLASRRESSGRAKSKHLGKGILAGIVGGLVGSIALRAWMTVMSQVHEGTTVPDQNGPAHQVAGMVFRGLTGGDMTARQRFLYGEAVHYAFGAVTGGIYGGIAEYQAWTTAGKGLLFGTGVFLAADESSMPLLGLIPPPWTEIVPAQVEHWAAHLVFGIAGELTRRRLRQAG